MNIKKNKQISSFPSDSQSNLQWPFKVKNRDDESKLIKEFDKFISQERTTYAAINMGEISLSSSSLLRFLAHISSNNSDSDSSKYIIVFSLDYSLFNKMIEHNAYFYKEMSVLQHCPYWYKGQGILLFSSVENSNFNFADVLYGEKEQNFKNINHIVSHTFPNTWVITSGKKLGSLGKFSIPNCLKPFFYQSSLLPFDLLLKEEGEILFQSNLKTLLSQELI